MAQDQIQRIVALVAWMSQRDSDEPRPYGEVARQLGVSVPVLKGDLQVLLDLTDRHKDWLSSLTLVLTAEGFIAASRGAYRRPLRLSRDEALALMVGLTGVTGGRQLAARLGSSFGTAPAVEETAEQWAIGPTEGAGVAQTLALARQSRDASHKLELFYCGSSGDPTRRTVQVHQVVQAAGVWYLLAWCERAKAARRFRAERILEATWSEEKFTPRKDLQRALSAAELLAAEEPVMATVAFSPRIARWMREKYPAGQDCADGRYAVRLPVADPRWLACEVRQYGAEAEVLEPEGMREVMREVIR